MKRKIQNGIYLIIDPSMNRDILLSKLGKIVHEEIAAVQIWDNFGPTADPVDIINDILHVLPGKNIPILINNRWELAKQTDIDGVHFDDIQDNILDIKKELSREIIMGITCGNDLSIVKWADDNGMDYISFCSMFPSPTANSCELVTFDTVKEAMKITSIPVFLAGGITPENMDRLTELDYAGIAVVSGIMRAERPDEALKKYQKHLKNKSK